METINNLANTAATTASKLIYGDQAKSDDAVDQTKNNETAGKEPISGVEGSGTAAQPYDQGNAATPLAAADKPTFLDYGTTTTTDMDTAGKEPVSGALGKGTVTEPFDQGNDAKATAKATETSSGSNEFLKLDPTRRGPSDDKFPDPQGEPKVYSDGANPSYAGMPIVPLHPDAATSSSGPKAASATETTGITDKTGVSEQVWKDTPIDDISRSGAPGAGPNGPDHVTPAVPDTTKSDTTKSTTTNTDSTAKNSIADSMTASSGSYESSAPKRSETDAMHDSKTDAEKATETRDTPAWTSTGVPSDKSHFDPADKPNVAGGEPKGFAGEMSGGKSEPHRQSEPGSSPSNDEHGSKMSSLKEKMKTKLHIGSKDK
ncbi:hypothetical protein BDW02DRAFT_245456 [Decorospora gaudefroyi]|uniref:Glycine-rich cell wall structural protein 1 n=1 Tax=Decorospora gaudefroyi TaxID=184978 RepID=A0A6A5KKC1_9PLEO|nr:hypothetical protein BDW02DRAFT_245456 [Decorospora gaudefroyi]